MLLYVCIYISYSDDKLFIVIQDKINNYYIII